MDQIALPSYISNLFCLATLDFPLVWEFTNSPVSNRGGLHVPATAVRHELLVLYVMNWRKVF